MDIDAELRRQIVVSLAAVLVFVVGLVAVGSRYGTGTGSSGEISLAPAGGIALVGLLGGFVLLMALVGVYLMRANDTDGSI
ncbi:DUF7472 family protein [Halopenitus persicus]|uniref:Uncharacterized protein n=1 Tax=Halopenitus persicus TaxID=1048396 RepID=A0A1H3FMI9_9EURY|nr:hypothetical protein [Halopenitus persicus]QHS16721.1 hypothetical protein GWK26_05930 [haloarchaeon 3A1-DGR]SDX92151.1 hypothetical protein SAMN05216564_102130 [Halopenitus persicus]